MRTGLARTFRSDQCIIIGQGLQVSGGPARSRSRVADISRTCADHITSYKPLREKGFWPICITRALVLEQFISLGSSDGMSSNDSRADTGASLLILGWTLTAVAGGVVGLRTYTSMTRLKRLSVADYLMLGSLVSHCLSRSNCICTDGDPAV